MSTDQEVLLPELREQRYTYADMDRAYADGVEDLADKIATLIRDSDYDITVEEIEAFIEAEVGSRPLTLSAEELEEAR